MGGGSGIDATGNISGFTRWADCAISHFRKRKGGVFDQLSRQEGVIIQPAESRGLSKIKSKN